MQCRAKSPLFAPRVGRYDRKVDAACCAERVKVVVRVRPPFEHETGGAVKIAPDGKALVLYRECEHSNCVKTRQPACHTSHVLPHTANLLTAFATQSKSLCQCRDAGAAQRRSLALSLTRCARDCALVSIA